MISESRIIELIAPALEVLWSIKLNIQDHPGCPLKPAAEEGINSLQQLMQEANEKETSNVAVS